MPDLSPPPCRHRGAAVAPALHRCQSPKLVGLKLVTPDDCGVCWCRGHPPLAAGPSRAAARLRACAHLGEPLNGAGGPFACHHPAHAETTVERCRTCVDYLFPLLTPRTPAAEARRHLDLPPRPQPHGWWSWPGVGAAHTAAADDFLAQLAPYPKGRFQGRGIVIAGGGRFFPSLYVTVRAIRHAGCRLPIQVWYLGRNRELPDAWQALLHAWDVECVDADAVRQQQPARTLDGWELKVFATRHSPFEEVLFLDADCYPCRNPEFLFDRDDYRRHGAIFWAEIFSPDPRLRWEGFGVADPGRSGSVESGQFVVHKRTSWRPLSLTGFYNDHSDYYYRHGYGDKHTFQVAWARCRQPFVMWRPNAEWREVAYIHEGPDREPLFVHRCADKFRFRPDSFSTPQRTPVGSYQPQLPLERECWRWLAELTCSVGSRGTAADVPKPRRVVRIGLPHHFNCSLIEHNGRLLLASRQGTVGARLHVSELDDDYQPLYSRALNVVPPLATFGVEDPRLFRFRGRLHCAFTAVEAVGAGIRTHQFLARLTDDLAVESAWRPLLDGGADLEKNWQFFEHDDALYSIYSIRPHVVLRHDAEQARIVARTSCALPWDESWHLRGGAPPVRVGDEFYHFFHGMRQIDGAYCYTAGLYTFAARPPFVMQRVAPGWLLTPDEHDRPAGSIKSVVFPCGALLRDGQWEISYGYHDQECRVAVFEAEAVERWLNEPLSSQTSGAG